MLAIYITAQNDRNGNPRRGWIIVDDSGVTVDFVDEGYSGREALAAAGYPRTHDTSRVEVTPREYASRVKRARDTARMMKGGAK
jgi:hypothetical protein